jgi:ribonuclease HI
MYRAYFDCSYDRKAYYGVGYAIVDPGGVIIKKHSDRIKMVLWVSNTYPKERHALSLLVRELVRLQIKQAAIFGDHHKVIHHVKKHYDKSLGIKPRTLEQLQSSKKVMSQIVACLRQIPEWTLEYIPSNKNVLADFLAKDALGVRRSLPIGEWTKFHHRDVEHVTWVRD